MRTFESVSGRTWIRSTGQLVRKNKFISVRRKEITHVIDIEMVAWSPDVIVKEDSTKTLSDSANIFPNEM
jgi:hypothetical protein